MTVPSRSFPCERALIVGHVSVFTSDVFYCLDCYDFACAMSPAIVGNARRLTLLRGITCGGGAAQD